MKFALGLFGLGLLLLAGGCAVEPAYSGYGGSVYGEYPYTTGYGYNYSYPAPYYQYHYVPYDRDHYYDRYHYWDRHHYPYGSRHYDYY